MIRFLLCFLVFATMLISFKREKTTAPQEPLVNDVQKITELSINAILPHDTILKHAYLLENRIFRGYLFTKDQKKEDSLSNVFIHQLPQKLDSIKKKFEASTLCVFLNDTVGDVNPDERIKSYFEPSSKNYFRRNKIEKTWLKEIELNKCYAALKSINFENLNKRYIYAFTSQKKQLSASTMSVGVINISSVYFNQQKDKALVCAEYLSNMWYCRESLIFLEKKDGEWSVVEKYWNYLDAVFHYIY